MLWATLCADKSCTLLSNVKGVPPPVEDLGPLGYEHPLPELMCIALRTVFLRLRTVRHRVPRHEY